MLSKNKIDAFGYELQVLRDRLKKLHEDEKTLADLFKAEGQGTFQGNDITITVDEVERESLDMQALQKKVKDEIIESCKKVNKYFQVKVHKN